MLPVKPEANVSGHIGKESAKKPPEVLPTQHNFLGHSCGQDCYTLRHLELQVRMTSGLGTRASPTDVGAASWFHVGSH